MRFGALAAILAVLSAGSDAALGKTGWTSAGTYGHRAPVKEPHDANNAKEAAKVNGAKVKQGTPSGASGSSSTSGAAASGPHSHPLHGAGSEQWH
jgi:hypothetical protein